MTHEEKLFKANAAALQLLLVNHKRAIDIFDALSDDDQTIPEIKQRAIFSTKQIGSLTTTILSLNNYYNKYTATELAGDKHDLAKKMCFVALDMIKDTGHITDEQIKSVYKIVPESTHKNLQEDFYHLAQSIVMLNMLCTKAVIEKQNNRGVEKNLYYLMIANTQLFIDFYEQILKQYDVQIPGQEHLDGVYQTCLKYMDQLNAKQHEWLLNPAYCPEPTACDA